MTLRVLQPIRHGLSYWRSQKDLPCTALPNLVAGRGVVGEVVAWGLGGVKEAEGAVEKLLMDEEARRQQVGGGGGVARGRFCWYRYIGHGQDGMCAFVEGVGRMGDGQERRGRLRMK